MTATQDFLILSNLSNSYEAIKSFSKTYLKTTVDSTIGMIYSTS